MFFVATDFSFYLFVFTFQLLLFIVRRLSSHYIFMQGHENDYGKAVPYVPKERLDNASEDDPTGHLMAKFSEKVQNWDVKQSKPIDLFKKGMAKTYFCKT